MNCSKYQNVKALDILKTRQWKLQSFNDILTDETRKATKIKKKDYLNNGEYPIIDQGKEFIAGYTNLDTVYGNTPIILFGDHTRILKYIDFPIFIGADGVKLLKNQYSEEEILTKYLYYYLSTVNIPDTGYNRHFKYLKEIVFPITNIDSQKRIVNVLDKARDLIDKRQDQIEALDQLIKSMFLEMFGDPVKNSKKWVTNKIAEVAPVQQYKGDIGETEIWLLNLDKVESNTGKVLEYVYIDKESIGDSTIKFDKENVLYSKLRPYLNKVVMPNEKGVATSELIPLKPNKEVVNRFFLTHLLRSDYFVSFISERVVGAKMPRVSMDIFKKFELITPPIHLQNNFAHKVEQIEKQKSLMQSSVVELEKMYNALLQSAFKDELFSV